MTRYLLLILLLATTQAFSAQDRLRLATTTSTENSGLLTVLHPPFERAHGIKVDVIAVGTGKALKLGENGDVDVVMVHAPAAEERFMAAGLGVDRLPVMHNDFVLLGPSSDPAAALSADTVTTALVRIANRRQPFVSRGDDSGTHKKEMSLWSEARITPGGDWYLSAGQGMGAVLKIADDKRAYTLSDRGTYLAFKNRTGLVIISQGDPVLHNPYHVIMVNPQQNPHVKQALAKKYIDYIRSSQGQHIIRNFRVSGQQLFIPDVVH